MIAAAMVMVAAAALIARCPIMFVANMFSSQLIDRIRRTRSWQLPEGAGYPSFIRQRPVVPGCVVVGLIVGVTATKPVAIGACELGCRGSIG
ncbi:hypothetical protein [Nocardia cyriacigeorgica]|uniref:hypothetical protein n=1 Tax=Nocardia cyriacigeorgica TaxID=135487 RepID=UPI00245831CA|nr:hypothetical protein [Nocardia cyriacigeorgica]